MVNYRDPAVVEQDGCAYAFAVTLGSLGAQLTYSFDSGSG